MLEGTELVSFLPSLIQDVMLVTYSILAVVIRDQRLCLVPTVIESIKVTGEHSVD